AKVLDDLPGSRVLGQDELGDPVRAQLVEGAADRELLRLGADALAPQLGLADEDAQLGRRLAAEAVKRREAHRLLAAVDADGPLEVGTLLPRRALHPGAGVRLAERLALLDQPLGDGGRVEPAVDRARVRRPEVPQPNLHSGQPNPSTGRVRKRAA